jgi:hypothetical protein
MNYMALKTKRPIFLEIIILRDKMFLQISHFCKMDDYHRNPLNDVEEKTLGKMEGDVTNTKTKECSFSIVTLCDRHLFRKASPSSTAYRRQQQTVSYILGSSERLRTWITDK